MNKTLQAPTKQEFKNTLQIDIPLNKEVLSFVSDINSPLLLVEEDVFLSLCNIASGMELEDAKQMLIRKIEDASDKETLMKELSWYLRLNTVITRSRKKLEEESSKTLEEIADRAISNNHL